MFNFGGVLILKMVAFEPAFQLVVVVILHLNQLGFLLSCLHRRFLDSVLLKQVSARLGLLEIVKQVVRHIGSVVIICLVLCCIRN